MLRAAAAPFPADLCWNLPKGRFSILFEESSPLILSADMATYSNGFFKSFLTLRLFMFLIFKLIVRLPWAN